MNITERNFESEFRFFATRSSGKGGQHVNKVSTRVELVFNVQQSQILSEEEKERLTQKLAKRISADGDLRIATDAFRSQLLNKKECVRKFYELMQRGLATPKKRKPTKPSQASMEKKKQEKKKLSEKKKLRRDRQLKNDV